MVLTSIAIAFPPISRDRCHSASVIALLHRGAEAQCATTNLDVGALLGGSSQVRPSAHHKRRASFSSLLSFCGGRHFQATLTADLAAFTAHFGNGFRENRGIHRGIFGRREGYNCCGDLIKN